MRKWGTALVLVWLLIHPSVPPQFTKDESRGWTIVKRLWHYVWNRNDWVATSAYDTKAECHARRDKAAEQRWKDSRPAAGRYRPPRLNGGGRGRRSSASPLTRSGCSRGR